MEQGRRRVEAHIPPCRMVAITGEAVRPRMQKGDACSTTIQGSVLEVIDEPQNLFALMAKRGTEHSVAWKKGGFQTARLKVDRCRGRRERCGLWDFHIHLRRSLRRGG